MSFHPYLNFGGDCREAFTRYQAIFGGELALMSMRDLPDGGASMPAEQADLIMHAALQAGGSLLMGSDDPSGNHQPADSTWVNFTTGEVADAQRVFEALADGGKVVMPLEETFWSPCFGMCVDRWGTPWMVNVEPAEGA